MMVSAPQLAHRPSQSPATIRAAPTPRIRRSVKSHRGMRSSVMMGTSCQANGAGAYDPDHTHIFVHHWSALRTAPHRRSSHRAVQERGTAHRAKALQRPPLQPQSHFWESRPCVFERWPLFLDAEHGARATGRAKGGEGRMRSDFSKVPFGMRAHRAATGLDEKACRRLSKTHLFVRSITL